MLWTEMASVMNTANTGTANPNTETPPGERSRRSVVFKPTAVFDVSGAEGESLPE